MLSGERIGTKPLEEQRTDTRRMDGEMESDRDGNDWDGLHCME